MQNFTIATLALVFGLGCSGVSELDVSRIYSRAGWQLPDRVVASLGIEPGDRVADLGSGKGYFLPYLSAAVGSAGTVFAVDVDAEVTAELAERVADEGLENVVVILGDFDDPKLPEGGVDLVFLCNTYHHIEQRPEYFARLRADLRPGGRVAVVDPDAEGSGVLHLFQNEGHMTSAADLADEMARAGYERTRSHEFLPTQIFAVFSPQARVH